MAHLLSQKNAKGGPSARLISHDGRVGLVVQVSQKRPLAKLAVPNASGAVGSLVESGLRTAGVLEISFLHSLGDWPLPRSIEKGRPR
jgi:hypothetical protein